MELSQTHVSAWAQGGVSAGKTGPVDSDPLIKDFYFITIQQTLFIFVFVVNSCPGGSSDATSYTPRPARESSLPTRGASREH